MPSVCALADGDDLAALCASLDELARAQGEDDSTGFDLGFLTPLLETFLDDYQPGAESDELAPPAPNLEFDEWVANYFEDCGPYEDFGTKLVLEYSFDF